jgi:hypothetical protein
MATCEVCGNDYEMAFQVITAGRTHTFDSFECAIHKLAPVCEHCGCKVIGHGVEANGSYYCCAHCAHAKGARSIVDNAEHATRQSPVHESVRGARAHPMHLSRIGIPRERI